jgi:hypothetical protein
MALDSDKRGFVMRFNTRIITFVCLLISIAFLGTCSEDPETIPIQPATQGLQGTIYFLEGNFMPPSTGAKTPVERELHIYELTTLGQVTRVNTGYPGIFISIVQTKLIAKVQSDDEGKFSVGLPPGRYSLMVIEGDLLYVNLFEGMGMLFPVEVIEGEYKEIEFKIDYMAVY